ncbi:ribose-phosphate pyrophosphokinase [Deltaproteobacteria bacterium PRO3]|nr:ribose-phosphate pyrophosphokinase [Deltaproteobacteria bacterium PRO3]
MRPLEDIKIFSGNANLGLAREICDSLGVPLGAAQVKRFSDGEVWVEIDENVRGKDVFIIQSTSRPANEHLMELLIMIDALKRASAERITAVMPYYGYARQDRKVQPRTPITSKLVADLITSAGAHRVLSVDLHAGQIQGFFNIPFDHLYATPILLDYIKENLMNDLVIVSPDAGGAERARAYAKRLEVGLAMIDKRRTRPNVSEVMNVIGEVEGKTAIIVDDMVDTAGTLTQAAQALADNGAKRVFACATHGVLSGPAVERIEKSVLSALVVTNTISQPEAVLKHPKIKVLSMAKLLGEAISRITHSDSVSSLFV